MDVEIRLDLMIFNKSYASAKKISQFLGYGHSQHTYFLLLNTAFSFRNIVLFSPTICNMTWFYLFTCGTWGSFCFGDQWFKTFFWTN